MLQRLVVIGTVGLWRHNDVGLLKLYYAAKKYGEPMILRLSLTNLGSLYMMVTSERSENEGKTTLLELLVCWRWGRYAVPNQQGDSILGCGGRVVVTIALIKETTSHQKKP